MNTRVVRIQLYILSPIIRVGHRLSARAVSTVAVTRSIGAKEAHIPHRSIWTQFHIL